MPRRSEYPLQTGHTGHVLSVVIGKTRKSVNNLVIDTCNDLTIHVSMKKVSQHMTFKLAEELINF